MMAHNYDPGYLWSWIRRRWLNWYTQESQSVHEVESKEMIIMNAVFFHLTDSNHDDDDQAASRAQSSSFFDDDLALFHFVYLATG